MKNLKSYELISIDGKTHLIAAKSKKDVRDFWLGSKIKKLTLREDIMPESCFII